VLPEKEQKTSLSIDENSTLSDYLQYAAINNPALKAAFYEWKAALERIPQVKALPDPRFTYTYFIREIETRAGTQEHKVAISQTFPWFGKLSLRGDIAFQQAEAKRLLFETAKYRLFYDVKKAYYEYYYLGRATKITREHLELLKYLEEIARAKLRFGSESSKDVVKIQVELGKIDNRLKELLEMRTSLMAKLNETLNMPVDTFLPFPQSIPMEHIKLKDKELMEWIKLHNPELKSIKAEIKGAERAVKLAKKNYFPDFTIGAQYIETDDNGVVDSGKDAVLASVSMNIPIWIEKYRAGEKEALLRLSSLKKRYRERENNIFSELKNATFGLRDSLRRMSFFHDTIIPVAEHSLMATQQAYQLGTGDFLDVIDAQRDLLEFNLSYERALTDYAIKMAEIEKIIGAPLPKSK
ncbi:MAG: TolC family protein, partial [Nitrospirae bacterium]